MRCLPFSNYVFMVCKLNTCCAIFHNTDTHCYTCKQFGRFQDGHGLRISERDHFLHHPVHHNQRANLAGRLYNGNNYYLDTKVYEECAFLTPDFRKSNIAAIARKSRSAPKSKQKRRALASG